MYNLLNTFKNVSLKVKSNLIFIVVVLVPTISLGALILHETNQLLKQQSVEYTERILDTIENNLTTIIQDVEDISTYMIFNDEFRRYLVNPPNVDGNEAQEDLEEELKGFSVFHLMSKNYIDSISLRGIKGNELYLGEPFKANEKKWESMAHKKAGAIVWSHAYPIHSYWSGETNVITLFREINDINNINRKIGLVKIRLNEHEIQEFIDSGLPDESGSSFILSEGGKVVLHKNKGIFGEKYPDSELLQKLSLDSDKTSFTYTVHGKDFLVATRKIERSGWVLVTMVDEGDILQELRGVGFWIVAFLALTIILGGIAIAGFYITIVRPLITLADKTRRVEHGDFSVFVKVRSNDEIGKLEYRFNRMVETIQQLINTKYKLEIKQRESELKALQNQINPHFLYNTLDMIRWTARIENAMETSRLIELLSKMFRISLSKGKIWIPLSEEISYVESYLELQKKRMGDKLRYDFQLEEVSKTSLIMKQILQPLVENSILHGLRGMKEIGHIIIKSSVENGDLTIDILDNGVGIDVEKANLLLNKKVNQETEGFALSNVNDRLVTAFGSEYGLTFIGMDKPGTWVRIRLPFIVTEEDLI
jgi:two-component system, sensor histidine kinase YesM